MNNTRLTLTIAAVLTLGIGACGKKTPSRTPSDAGTSVGQVAHDAAKVTGVAVEDAVIATGDALGNAIKVTGECLNQSKDTAVEAAKETLNGLDKGWHELLAKTAPTTDEAKNAAADAWRQDVKPALDTALHKAQILYKDISTMFSNH